MKKIKILLLVAESWRHDDAGGNVIDNLFSGMNAEFAHIFTSADLPKNNSCYKYFQITTREIVKNFLSRKAVGKVLNINQINQEHFDIEKKDRQFIDFFRNYRWEIFLLLKNFVWRFSNWKTPKLEQFILTFDPDVVFTPCYTFPFQFALTRYVSELTGKKIVLYSWDDCYSLRQFSLSPFFWINRLWTHFSLKKTYPYYDLFYSMSEDEIEELTPIVKKEINILRKGTIPKDHIITPIHTPIRIIYAGGIYINRWRILAEIGKTLKEINKQELKITLNIYTQNTITKKQKKVLDDGRNIFVHGVVDKSELDKLYSNSDIALHVESFTRKSRLATRLSFSTKIIDCLASGCAVIAIAWKEHTGLKYLQKQDAAICITNIKQIYPTFQYIVNNKEFVIKSYSKKAHDCALKNHDINKIQHDLYSKLLLLATE